MVDRLTADLLGRHVAHRAQDDAEARQGVRGGRRLVGAGRTSQFRHTEVQDLHAAIAREEQVLGLQVAMDDATLVRGGESPGDLHGEVDGLPLWHGAAPEPAAERLAFEQLRDDVGHAVLTADVVDDQEIGMVERAGGPGLRLESLDALRVRGGGA